MKKTSQTLDESKNKIKFMMSYDSKKTLTEQAPLQPSATTAPGMNKPYNPNEITVPGLINSYARRLKRNYARIDAIMKEIQGKTYQGKPAIDGVKASYKSIYKKDLPGMPVATTATTAQTATQTPVGAKDAEGYKLVAGTPQDPYIYGTTGSGIMTVQQNLGFTGTDLDGKWGPNTQKALAAKAPDIKQFTNDDLSSVVQKIRGGSPIAKANTSSISRPTVAPTQPTAQLAGQQKPQQNLAYNTNTAATKGV